MNEPSRTCDPSKYPPISDYALISNCRSVALVSKAGSIDWCCMPRVDSDSCFGRLLDRELGGYCAITPTADDWSSWRMYEHGTMVLVTHFKTPGGEVKIYDFFAMGGQAASGTGNELIRIVEGVTGICEVNLEIVPRFDFGEIIPRVRQYVDGIYTVIGGNKGLIVSCDVPLEGFAHRNLTAKVALAAGKRIRLCIQCELPETLDEAPPRPPNCANLDQLLEETTHFWRTWIANIQPPYSDDQQTMRSALILKALTFEQTGAIVAAATTSLPESIGGERNWDYRFSWIRDSMFSVKTLCNLGYNQEADRFRRFIERSSAGSADELQIMYGVDGKRRLTEINLDWLEGYKCSRPIRIGNGAAKQVQMDIYGELLELEHVWRLHGNQADLDPDYWEFLVEIVNLVCKTWREPDAGIWEVRGGPWHFVHSKAMCWVAINCGIKIAKEIHYPTALEHWLASRSEIRTAIETEGYDSRRGIFVQAFGRNELDASLLLLPQFGFIDYKDERMMRTTAAIQQELAHDGLLMRYLSPDGLPGTEGIFLACTYWLVDCLAHQGFLKEAYQYYNRANACANDLGLFSEEFDVVNNQLLGNFPQGLSHLSQIMARLALEQTTPAPPQ